jgi:hypothetical protein
MSDLKARLDLLERWVVALRSGDYEQGMRRLRVVDEGKSKWCCLGILAEVFDSSRWSPEPMDWTALYWDDHSAHSAGLTTDLRLAIGADDSLVKLSESIGGKCTLAGLNDVGMPFSEIADVIEEQFIKPLRQELGVSE